MIPAAHPRLFEAEPNASPCENCICDKSWHYRDPRIVAKWGCVGADYRGCKCPGYRARVTARADERMPRMAPDHPVTRPGVM